MDSAFAKRARGRLALLTVLCVLGILAATLWPFQFLAKNQVAWSSGQRGLSFAAQGLVRSGTQVSACGDADDPAAQCSIELYINPASEHGVHAILALYAPDTGKPVGPSFQIGQYQDDLLLIRHFRDATGRARKAELDADHVLHAGTPVFLTITSGPHGTRIYANGLLVQRSGDFRIAPADLRGELLLGSSPLEYLPWSGDFLGLAFYRTELARGEVQQHFAFWRARQEFREADWPAATAWYGFAEGSGTVTKSSAPGGTDLLSPEKYSIPYKPFLNRPWREFHADRDYVVDVLRNIVGFMPLGFLLAAWIRGGNGRRAMLRAVCAGAVLSLSVEILQAFLPSRTSGITDILTNTFGTYLGARIALGEAGAIAFRLAGDFASELKALREKYRSGYTAKL